MRSRELQRPGGPSGEAQTGPLGAGAPPEDPQGLSLVSQASHRPSGSSRGHTVSQPRCSRTPPFSRQPEAGGGEGLRRKAGPLSVGLSHGHCLAGHSAAVQAASCECEGDVQMWVRRQASAILETRTVPWKRRPRYISESPSYIHLSSHMVGTWWLSGNCHSQVCAPSPVTVYPPVLLR